MKQPEKRHPQLVHRPFFPLIIILFVNILTGLLTFKDYGQSWDEPLFYQYADAVPYAYSLPAHLSGSFDIEKAYGPSAEDHKIYGPIYLLLAKPVVDMLDYALPIPRADLWHLVNFLTFQVGVAIFFALCLRWMRPWAVFGATLLFCTQPVLWGHAWINPKDVPFTVFFLAAIYFGYKMVDALAEPVGVGQEPAPVGEAGRGRRVHHWRISIQVVAVIFIVLSLVGILFYNQLQVLLRDVIHAAYTAAPGSVLGKLFAILAANAQVVAEEAYISKALVLFVRLKTSLLALSLVFLIPAILLTFWSASVEQAFVRLGRFLSPLPRRPAWNWRRLASPGVLVKVILAGVLLGLVVSIRIIGPLAGVLVMLFFFLKNERRSLAGLVIYIITALIAMYLVWPYLWDAPIGRFIEVLQHMSHNPKVLPVLFNGTVFPSDKLPLTYLPVMLGITLTWPIWPLFISGLIAACAYIRSKLVDWRSLAPVVLWFLVPFAYVLAIRPPVYDGYRHFLFILPPVFIIAGLAIQAIVGIIKKSWQSTLVLTVLVIPAVIGLVKLHPYEYTYYNSLVGGTGGAFRHYETDFWLTCYKELMGEVNSQVIPGTTLFVHRQPSIASEYASPDIVIEKFDPQEDETFTGSLLLLTTRANVDLSIHPEAKELFSAGRDGAKFCLVKEIP